MSANIDKVNMSLDDIIKLEKRQKRFQPQNNNGRGKANTKGAPNAGGKPRGRGRPPINNQQRKPFGLLNKSKAIGKNNNLPNKPRGRPRGPGPAKANVLAAATSLKSRLSGPGIGPKQQQLGKMQNLARIRRRRNPAANPPANRAFNRYGGPNGRQPNQQAAKFQNQPQQQVPRAPANKLGRKPIIQPKQAIQRRPGVGGLNKAQSDLVKAKIAMQAARKNVQKAKRLLAARKAPIQQIATKKFAKNLAVKKIKQRVQVAKKAKLIAKTSQPRGMIRVNVPNSRKAAQPQSTKPIIKRSRPAQKQAPAAGKSGGNRMVFY